MVIGVLIRPMHISSAMGIRATRKVILSSCLGVRFIVLRMMIFSITGLTGRCGQ